MNYANYLKAILHPLRAYDLDRGIGAAELGAVGQQMDTVFDHLEDIESGIATPAAYLPLLPVSDEENIIPALSIPIFSAQKHNLEHTLSLCGVPVSLEELSPLSVKVNFGDQIPQRLTAAKALIESLLPCHLTISYDVITPDPENPEIPDIITWAYIEAQNLTWAMLELIL